MVQLMRSTLERAEERGIEKGIERGQIEERKKNALNFLKAGVDAETIAKATGLTVEEVKNLKRGK